mmetsp:Transcript_111386/g.311308  ORF Transcript_111386/g.311308 Transcript_111386/m.311308 type:complete len:269 (-) Transcript_111386:34-840(-)
MQGSFHTADIGVGGRTAPPPRGVLALQGRDPSGHQAGELHVGHQAEGPPLVHDRLRTEQVLLREGPHPDPLAPEPHRHGALRLHQRAPRRGAEPSRRPRGHRPHAPLLPPWRAAVVRLGCEDQGGEVPEDPPEEGVGAPQRPLLGLPGRVPHLLADVPGLGLHRTPRLQNSSEALPGRAGAIRTMRRPRVRVALPKGGRQPRLGAPESVDAAPPARGRRPGRARGTAQLLLPLRRPAAQGRLRKGGPRGDRLRAGRCNAGGLCAHSAP